MPRRRMTARPTQCVNCNQTVIEPSHPVRTTETSVSRPPQDSMHALSRLRYRIETAEWQAWLPGAVEIVLVSLLALHMVRLAWLVLVPAGPVVEAVAAPMTVAEPAPSLPTVDVFFRSAA